jgi:hypothetical protein
MIVLIPSILIWWIYRRVLTSQETKILMEFKTGNFKLFKALWNLRSNKVTLIKGRKDKLDLEKSGDPRLVNLSATRREWWFLCYEGINKTIQWPSQQKDKAGRYNPAYAASGLTEDLVASIKKGAEQSFKGQMFGLIAGLGGGVGIGILIAYLFGIG